MKTSVTALSLVCLIGVASAALAEVQRVETRVVNVPAGNLSDAVESLARQTGVDVMYPGNLLEGLSTRGVSGTHAPAEAFGKLLEGTSLALVEDDGALRISQATRPEQRVVAGNAPPQVGTEKPSNGVSANTAGSGTDSRLCHRVSEHGRTQVYCGSAEQWASLKSRVGFRCEREGRRNELCASANEWKRLTLNASRNLAFDGRNMSDENDRTQGVLNAQQSNPAQPAIILQGFSPPMEMPTPPQPPGK